jgi:hypothetical protein
MPAERSPTTNARYLRSRAALCFRMRRSRPGASVWFASRSIAFGPIGLAFCSRSELTPTGSGSRLLLPGASDGELVPVVRASHPLFIPQIAACVRLWTRILRRIVVTWTFTAASAISIFRAMDLLEAASIRQRSTDFSRGASCGASASSAVTKVASLLSWRGPAASEWSPSGPRTNDINSGGRTVSPIIISSIDLMNTSHVMTPTK